MRILFLWTLVKMQARAQLDQQVAKKGIDRIFHRIFKSLSSGIDRKIIFIAVPPCGG